MKPHLVDLVPAAFNRGRRLFAIATLSAACAAGLSPFAYADGGRDHRGRAEWTTAWGTSQQPNVEPFSMTNATVRMIARVSIPGEAVRIRLDNTFGTSPSPSARRMSGHASASHWLRPGSIGP